VEEAKSAALDDPPADGHLANRRRTEDHDKLHLHSLPRRSLRVGAPLAYPVGSMSVLSLGSGRAEEDPEFGDAGNVNRLPSHEGLWREQQSLLLG